MQAVRRQLAKWLQETEKEPQLISGAHARFIGPNAVRVRRSGLRSAEDRHHVGGRAVLPDGRGPRDVAVLTNTHD